jgi:signal transduction histidine kinase
VDVNDVLTKLEAKFRKTLGTRRTLEMKLASGLPQIKADPQDLRENLFRLVLEARDAMPDGGAVEASTSIVMARDGRQSIQVAIRDTGKDIRADAGDRVFDPYYQSRPGRRNPGFALALVYQFVAVSGGFIEVKSAPGEGAAWLLTFPAVDASEAPAMRAEEPLAAAVVGNMS